MDPVKQVIARVCVCIIGTLITALAQFPLSSLEIGTSKNGVKENFQFFHLYSALSGLY